MAYENCIFSNAEGFDGTPKTAEALAHERARRVAFPSMSDQAIRAHALECACLFTGPSIGKLAQNLSAEQAQRMLWEIVHDLEAYIRDGVT